MSDDIVFQKDDLLLLRDFGSPVSGFEFGEPLYMTRSPDRLDCLLLIPSGNIVIAPGNTYYILFYAMSDPDDAGTQELLNTAKLVQSAGDFKFTIDMVSEKPFLRHFIFASGATASINCKIWIQDKS